MRLRKKCFLIPMTVLLSFVLITIVFAKKNFSSKGPAVYDDTPDERIVEDTDDQSIGTIRISTLQVPEGVTASRSTYTYTGSVILNYAKDGTNGVGIMQDDGSGFKSLINGYTAPRLFPYADNTRVLTGDQVLECPEGTTLDTCPENSMTAYNIVYPKEFTEDKKVQKIWSEIVLSPDNKHMAWTMLRTDSGAAIAIGELKRQGDVYTVENAKLCSHMNTYVSDPDREGYLIRSEVVGGEVKQFVHGGEALSVVGSDQSGVAQYVVVDIASGENTVITHTPSYDETTMFSPDEKYGITMSTRFSPSTTPNVLGIVPRPIGDAMQNITSVIYMYGVTGVRKERPGNIGPVLINIDRSTNEEDYRGICLADPAEQWVYASPMSWNPDSTKAMWQEKERGANHYRTRIAELLDYEGGEAVPASITPEPGDYADSEASVPDMEGYIEGKYSGKAWISKKTGFLHKKTVTVRYEDFSDDGKYFYNGSETSSGTIMTKTKYSADLHVTDSSGNEVGYLKGDMIWGPAYKISSPFTGSTSPVFDTKKSTAAAEWNGRKETASELVA